MLVHKWWNILSQVLVLKCHSWVLPWLKKMYQYIPECSLKIVNLGLDQLVAFHGDLWRQKQINFYLCVFGFPHLSHIPLYIFIRLFLILLKDRFRLPDTLCQNPKETRKGKQHFFISLWSKCQGPKCTHRTCWPCPACPGASPSPAHHQDPTSAES